MDLGSGDGRTVITAAKRGATAMGIEYNPDMVELSKKNASSAGVSNKATFVKADLFETDLSKAQVITMFLLPSINMKLRPKILDLKPGTRIVTNSFTMEDWQADPEGRLRGDQIEFTVGGQKYTGHVQGTTMKGTTAAGASWTATKKGV
jgi:tRNA G37 N-methylase Trm5